MSMKFNIELPFFPGFYESDLETSDTSYWAIKEELEYYQNDAGYEEEVRNAWAEAWKNNAPEIVLSVEGVEMTSPKYYNFETDRLWADVELSDDWQEKMRTFMQENAEWLRERIADDWTSYDGFNSYMSNNFDDLSHDEDEDYWGDKSWYWHLFSGQSRKLACYISTMIGYMMYRENSEIRNDLVMSALDDVYDGSYVRITKEGEEKLQELREQREEDIREGRITLPDPAQLEIPFEY